VMILIIVVSITAYQEEQQQKEIVSLEGLEELEKCMQILHQISHPNEIHLKQYDDCIENAPSSQNP
jgi:hypothetical protein